MSKKYKHTINIPVQEAQAIGIEFPDGNIYELTPRRPILDEAREIEDQMHELDVQLRERRITAIDHLIGIIKINSDVPEETEEAFEQLQVQQLGMIVDEVKRIVEGEEQAEKKRGRRRR